MGYLRSMTLKHAIAGPVFIIEIVEEKNYFQESSLRVT